MTTHCLHAPKCIGVDPVDERDPLGCCNCGTREAEAERANLAAMEQRTKDDHAFLDSLDTGGAS